MIRFLCFLLLLNSVHLYADMIWAEGECSKETGYKDGAASDYYNGAAALKWQSKNLDFSDADGLENGPRAFAENKLLSDKGDTWNEWDVSTLVNSWLHGEFPNQGFLVKHVGGGKQHFDSREVADETFHPYLQLTLKDKIIRLAIQADTAISGSTFKCLGNSHTLSGNGPILLYVDLSGLKSELLSASLYLHSKPKEYGSNPVYGIYRVNINSNFAPDPQASETSAADPDKYYYQQDFENSDWLEFLHKGSGYRSMRRVLENEDEGFVPISGFALEAKIPKGHNTGMSLSYFFKVQLGFEPEQAYFKYDLRLGEGWETVQGGKLPGLAGTYGTAGWGGRRSDGTNGWSARGIYKNVVPSRNPLKGQIPIGSYLYHADMPSYYGNSIIWNQNSESLGLLQRSRWYSIEQRVKMNTLGKKDGILEAWIDGRKVYSNHAVNFRTVDSLKIERVWLNIYHGGTATVKKDIYAFIDNIIISPEYIGTSPSP
jgi:hypothetical protein